jgi:hypothetical protein
MFWAGSGASQCKKRGFLHVDKQATILSSAADAIEQIISDPAGTAGVVPGRTAKDEPLVIALPAAPAISTPIAPILMLATNNLLGC